MTAADFGLASHSEAKVPNKSPLPWNCLPLLPYFTLDCHQQEASCTRRWIFTGGNWFSMKPPSAGIASRVIARVPTAFIVLGFALGHWEWNPGSSVHVWTWTCGKNQPDDIQERLLQTAAEEEDSIQLASEQGLRHTSEISMKTPTGLDVRTPRSAPGKMAIMSWWHGGYEELSYKYLKMLARSALTNV